MGNIKLTFLTEDEIIKKEQLKIFKEYGTKASLSDFSIILGAYVSEYDFVEDLTLKKYRTGNYWTKTATFKHEISGIDKKGYTRDFSCQSRFVAARPVLTFLSDQLIPTNAVRTTKGLDEIEYGEYPQTIAGEKISDFLEKDFDLGALCETGKKYTVDSRRYDDYEIDYVPMFLKEYEYNGKKYVRVKVNSHINGDSVTLSDGKSYKNDDYVWVSVEPIKWILKQENTYLSKKCVFAGVRFDKENGKYDDSMFEQTEINKFMQTFFTKDIIPSDITKSIKNDQPFTINNFTFVDKDGNKNKKRIVVKVKKN